MTPEQVGAGPGEDMGVTPSGSGSQASPGAATASPPPVSIPDALCRHPHASYTDGLRDLAIGDTVSPAIVCDVLGDCAGLIDKLAERVADLELALGCALEMLFPMEPPDSRAVSNEFVAMAAIEAGQTDRLDECREILIRYRDSDGSGEAGETAKTGSTVGDSAVAQPIAQSDPHPDPQSKDSTHEPV